LSYTFIFFHEFSNFPSPPPPRHMSRNSNPVHSSYSCNLHRNCTYIFAPTNIVYVYTHTYIYTHTCICACVYIHIPMHIYICIFTYTDTQCIFIYKHTYQQTHTQELHAHILANERWETSAVGEKSVTRIVGAETAHLRLDALMMRKLILSGVP